MAYLGAKREAPRDVVPHEPVHVVMVLGNNTYPSDARVRREAETLASAGHRVTVVAQSAAHEARRSLVNGVNVVRYPAAPEGRGTLAYLFEFSWVTLASIVVVLLLRLRQRIDVVHVHNPPDTLFLAGVLPRLLGARLVFDHHDLSPELFEAKFGGAGTLAHRGLLVLERWSCLAADRVLTVNESYRNSDIGRNGVRPERVVIVRNGPPLAHLEPVDPDPSLRDRAGTVIGYLGAIAVQDGVDHLIKGLFHLEEDFGHADWFAVVIGPAEDPRGLTDLARDLGVSEKIWFTGFQPDARWRTMLASTDICCVPDPANALNERSTMVKMMEYMALGKPVVAYDLSEHRVTAGPAALYAPPNDPLELARRFALLIEQPQLGAHLGSLGRERVRETLAWEHAATGLLETYATVRTW